MISSANQWHLDEAHAFQIMRLARNQAIFFIDTLQPANAFSE